MIVPASLGKSCPWGRKTEGTKKENAGFSSAQNTCKIYGVCSRVAVAQLSCFNCKHSHWLLLMWALVGWMQSLLHFCTMFWQQSERSGSFERFTMSVTQVVNHDEKLDDSGCGKNLKWEWVPIELEVKVCEEVKKECPSMQFYERYPYFHKNYHRLHRFWSFQENNFHEVCPWTS